MSLQLDYFVHESSYVDQPCRIGKGTKIWHFCHIMADTVIGERLQSGPERGCLAGVYSWQQCQDSE